MSAEKRSDVIRVDESDTTLVQADGYSVLEWSPDPTHATGPTEVHFILPLPIDSHALALRLKSRRAIQELIDTLIEHRNGVWPLS